MICEVVNKMWKFEAYVFGTPPVSETSVSAFDVAATVLCTIVIVCFLGWWVVPLRWAGVGKIRFHCKKTYKQQEEER